MIFIVIESICDTSAVFVFVKDALKRLPKMKKKKKKIKKLYMKGNFKIASFSNIIK